MAGTYTNRTLLFIFLLTISRGGCQFGNMFGSTNIMSMFGGGGSNPMMGGSGIMGSMSNAMAAMSDPLMALTINSVELGATDLMILSQMVQTIVGPGAGVNPGLMVLYNTDGGLPYNAVRMIPYITIMQGMAKDLKIRVPGVRGQANNDQIENYILQRAIQWMQSRNMAGAFMENAAMLMMSGAFGNFGNAGPDTSSAHSTNSAAANAAAAAQAAAAAHAAFAQYVAAQSGNNSTSATGGAAATAPKPAAPADPKPQSTPTGLSDAQSALLAQLMSGASTSQGATPSVPSGMVFPPGMSLSGMSGFSGMSSFGFPGMSGMGSSGGEAASASMSNPSTMMAMQNLDMMGF